MVDVSQKPTTIRTAVASTRLTMRSEVLDALLADRLPKGEALASAKVAGILAAKRTAEWIPLCHPLPLDWVDIAFSRQSANSVEVLATVRTTARTGAEMEALTAVSAAALTLYDMAKGADREIVIGPTQLERKEGGRSGVYQRRAKSARNIASRKKPHKEKKKNGQRP